MAVNGQDGAKYFILKELESLWKKTGRRKDCRN